METRTSRGSFEIMANNATHAQDLVDKLLDKGLPDNMVLDNTPEQIIGDIDCLDEEEDENE
jgi:hypothetical protein